MATTETAKLAAAPKTFFLGGKCFFTVEDSEGQHYTFRIRKLEADPGKGFHKDSFLIGLLTGPNNTRDYTNFGLVDAETGVIRLTSRSPYKYETLPVKVASFVLEEMWAEKELPEGVRFEMPSRCSRCGRMLTATNNPYFPWMGPECGSK